MSKIKEAMSLLSFEPDDLFENLSENEKKELLASCSTIFTGKTLGKICNEVYTSEVLNTIEKSKNFEEFLEGRGRILGIAGIIDLITKYHNQYIDSLKKDEKMTEEEKHEII